MKPWETVRREVLGAWRSIRYDLDRRPAADGGTGTSAVDEIGTDRPGDGASLDLRPVTPAAPAAPAAPADEDWYNRPLPERESIWAPLKDPRRVLAAGAVASIIAASATGTFFAVTGGLGILLADANAGAPAPQQTPAIASQAGASAPASRQHRTGPANRPPAATPARPSATTGPSPAQPPLPVEVTTAPPTHSPIPEATATASPTPPATASHSPSPSASPAASPSS